MKNFHLILCLFLLCGCRGAVKAPWGDTGDGSYTNPFLNADYSDPDVVRVGDKYYMVASDFHFLGMQVLESEDMVNWKLISQIYDRFDLPGWDSNSKYAGGSWAPSIRYHKDLFWVYFCTPHEGLFMSTASDPHGPWSPLHCVKSVEKWEDPCPFWDEDGKAYLGHSLHGAGPIIVHRMSEDGKTLLDEGVTVYHGPVAEGTKWLKRNGYYYLSIPEGGVGEGWQTLLRSRNIYGPYERKIVLETGSTDINGPHQGALVDTPEGEWWFFHFQHLHPAGRVVHLQPAHWTEDDWLEIGEDYDGNGVGEPVKTHRKPLVKARSKPFLPACSDDFSTKESHWAGQQQRQLGLQWQWCHNPVDSAWSLNERRGWLCLHALQADELKMCRGMVTQKTMGYQAVVETQLDGRSLIHHPECHAGLLCIGKSFRAIGLCARGVYTENDGQYELIESGRFPELYLRVHIDNEHNNHFFEYSTDGKQWKQAGESFPMRDGYWKGLRVGLFCYNKEKAGGKAYFNYFDYAIDKGF